MKKGGVENLLRLFYVSLYCGKTLCYYQILIYAAALLWSV
jgi:hypothetical protein